MNLPKFCRSFAPALLISSFAVSTLTAGTASAVSSAELYGLTSYRYGKFEARVQFPAGDGVVGSFFLWKSGSEMPSVYWNELDFEKVEETCELHLNNLYGLPEASHTSVVDGVSELCTQYHHYTIEWTPESIAWFVDGQEVRRDTGEGAQVYVDNASAGMIFDFNNWPGTVAFGGEFSPDILPVHEYISYVQYSAYTPGAGDGGSDFTFTWRESFDDGAVPSTFGRGNWESPLGQSTHVPANVNVVDGVLVLSLTADDATGYTGTPPVDPMDLPSEEGTAPPATGGSSSGTGGGSSATGGSSSGTGGDSSAAGGSESGGETEEPLPGQEEGGCSCRAAGRASRTLADLWLAAFALGAGLVMRVRRRVRV